MWTEARVSLWNLFVSSLLRSGPGCFWQFCCHRCLCNRMRNSNCLGFQSCWGLCTGRRTEISNWVSRRDLPSLSNILKPCRLRLASVRVCACVRACVCVCVQKTPIDQCGPVSESRGRFVENLLAFRSSLLRVRSRLSWFEGEENPQQTLLLVIAFGRSFLCYRYSHARAGLCSKIIVPERHTRTTWALLTTGSRKSCVVCVLFWPVSFRDWEKVKTILKSGNLCSDLTKTPILAQFEWSGKEQLCFTEKLKPPRQAVICSPCMTSGTSAACEENLSSDCGNYSSNIAICCHYQQTMAVTLGYLLCLRLAVHDLCSFSWRVCFWRNSKFNFRTLQCHEQLIFQAAALVCCLRCLLAPLRFTWSAPEPFLPEQAECAKSGQQCMWFCLSAEFAFQFSKFRCFISDV